ncbi:MAG: T9SS type A sorting domain-containing protein, partial [Bacteroidota bacterium]|nr:T9SS type A sorting domain-containing protein [Bacteroidota bacterium]
WEPANSNVIIITLRYNKGEDYISSDKGYKMTVHYIQKQVEAGVGSVAKNRELKVYPNPSNGRFVIEGKDLQGKAQIKVINMLGAVVMDENRVINNNAIEINISSLPVGIYNVSVQTKDGVVMRKVVKEFLK